MHLPHICLGGIHSAPGKHREGEKGEKVKALVNGPYRFPQVLGSDNTVVPVVGGPGSVMLMPLTFFEVLSHVENKKSRSSSGPSSINQDLHS